MHGGISPELKNKTDIDSINRFIEPPLHGFLCDLLWSDPMEDREARKLRFSGWNDGRIRAYRADNSQLLW